jgi:hypothetical protein
VAKLKDADDHRSSSGSFDSSKFPNLEIKLHNLQEELDKKRVAQTIMHELVHLSEFLYDVKDEHPCDCINQKITSDAIKVIRGYRDRHFPTAKLEGISDEFMITRSNPDDLIMYLPGFLAKKYLKEYYGFINENN